MKQYLNKEFLLSNKQLVIKVAAVLLIIAVAFFVFVQGNKDADETMTVQSGQEASGESQGGEMEKAVIIVDIGGAVRTPQVAELKEDSRVADAISAAGGLTEKADIAGINQAAFLTDGQKVYIPEKGEDLPASGSETYGSAVESGGKVNINSATSEQLQTLNGVGPATAEKILAYRSSNGYFKRIEDLKKVDGIGDKTFEKLKEQIMI